jgi:hypothetical protein
MEIFATDVCRLYFFFPLASPRKIFPRGERRPTKRIIITITISYQKRRKIGFLPIIFYIQDFPDAIAAAACWLACWQALFSFSPCGINCP